MKPYSMDLRGRVVAACDEGVDAREEIAERFSVSVSWIRDLLRRRRETGSIAPRPRGGGPPPALDAPGAERLRPAGPAGRDAPLAEPRQAAVVSRSASAPHRARARPGGRRRKDRV